MKNSVVILVVAFFACTFPLASFAENHTSGHDGHLMKNGTSAHEEVVQGVKVTFKVIPMKDYLKDVKLPVEMKETHHLMVEFKDAKTGKSLKTGEVKVKILGPDKSEQLKEMLGMEGHFGADINLSKKGKYGIMSKFLLKDGTVRSSKFWYVVK